ncbi:uncharacterized protein V1516DRAFT_680774 [Lipomyces oligophaga]|uniref:uncharacterized protein n=1 Tax=Lipomyces oligophaga TaxID=45792 RepID=UPI0034CF7B74
MAEAIETLRSALQTSSFLSMTKDEVEELYTQSYNFIIAGRQPRSVDSTELYSFIELHFYLALITCHDNEAATVLTTLSDRFGESSPRIGVMKALLIEATESFDKALDYLNGRPDTELGATKRRLAIMRATATSASLNAGYIKELNTVLDTFPSDGETWAELAQAYIDVGMYAQGLFALHEVLLLFPLAYNINAWIAEVTMKFAETLKDQGSGGVSTEEKYAEAVKFALRSVELCDDYVRGWSGVLVGSSKLLDLGKNVDKDLYKMLSTLARQQLEKIVEQEDARPEDLQAAEYILKSVKA